MSIRAQRIAIATIGIVMVVGTIGTYFLIILNNNAILQGQSSTTTTQPSSSSGSYDPTAYKVSGPVIALQITDLTIGTGAEAKAGDTVRVQYKGTIAQTGIKFDSSYDRGQPLTISLNNVIAGWQQGVPGMKVGGKRRLVIPAALAYGAQGSGSVPPNADLVFEIELLAVNPGK